MANLETYLLSVLESKTLAGKLKRPPAELLKSDRTDTHQPLWHPKPVRGKGLEMASGAQRLPKLHQLEPVEARISCLARFAHHELQAVELFAWILLGLPTMPRQLQRALLVTLSEEQLHCELYLERIKELGGSFDGPHSDYFWKHAEVIRSATNPLTAFLSVMGMTLEQANLDFTLMYRDAFEKVGDSESARIIQRVHDDEIRHVRLARRWLLEETGHSSDLNAFESEAPFPFTLGRAKGRRFHTEPRFAAGLSTEFVDAVKYARKKSKPATQTS